MEQERKLLKVNDRIKVESPYMTYIIDIDRVTKTLAIAGNTKFKLDYTNGIRRSPDSGSYLTKYTKI